MMKLTGHLSLKKLRLPMSLSTLMPLLLISVVLLIGISLTTFNYFRSRSMIMEASSLVLDHIQRETALQVEVIFSPITQFVDYITALPVPHGSTLDERLKNMPTFVSAMQRNAALSALYVGDENGDFFLLRRLGTAKTTLLNVAVPTDAFYMVQSIMRSDKGKIQGKFIFFTRALEKISEVEPDYHYDPRKRDWYIKASATSEQIQTNPYIFFSTHEIGITIAKATAHNKIVVGADIALTDLSALLTRQNISASAELLLIDKQRAVLSYIKSSDRLHPPLVLASGSLASLADLPDEKYSLISQKLSQQVFNTPIKIKADNRDWTSRIAPVAAGKERFYLVTLLPEDELLADANQMLTDGVNYTLLLLLMVVPLSYYIAWRVGQPLRKLAETAKTMQDLNFTQPIDCQSGLIEIKTLTRSIDETRLAILRFITLSNALAEENDLEALLNYLMQEVMSTAHVEVGLLYLFEKGNVLAKPYFSQVSGIDHAAPELNLDVNDDSVLSLTLHNACRTIRKISECRPSDHAILGDAVNTLDRMGSLIGIPLKDNNGEPLGAIMLGGHLSGKNEGSALLSFVEALSRTAATAIKNRQLIKEQNELLEAMIELVAGAIDAKSPYTGGHCQRVPILTKMLAEAACKQIAGPFADFDLTKEQWWELHVASGLHDCGKITTPEFVVDKATKLETIHDRIHEIRMRFEVLKREKEIIYLRTKLGKNAIDRDELLDRELQRLDDDFYFIASCNQGSESMEQDNIERIRSIATYQWTRTLDDRAGISSEELHRKTRTAKKELPAQEFLLEDRPEHLFFRSAQDTLAPDNEWGFRIDAPDYLYNRGEIYNLCIRKGTLTTEERYKINEHIIQTIKMLTRLPFPKHLKNVPDIAGGHHEKINGSGYPKRLRGEQMSVLAKMMAIADIFEALTAADRPYKKGKPLSEAISIMRKMQEEGHIDSQIFDLFLQQGLHLEYAHKYMPANQVDL